MGRTLGLDEVVDHFTLVGDEIELLSNKAGGTRLGFALALKFLQWRGRFAKGRHELADDAVEHVARQVGVPAAEFASYDFVGRTAQRHRSEIRRYSGFRECSVADTDKLGDWLARHVAEIERREDRVTAALLARCRAELIEPPTPGRVTEIVRSALHRSERALLALVAGRLDEGTVARLDALVADEDDPDDADRDALATIKADPGDVSLDSMLAEIDKLGAVRAVGLPADLFADVSPKVVSGWRARAAVESPSHLRAHPAPTRAALLSALLVEREREITDALVSLLISTVHRINARAERKVVDEFVKNLRRVTGKETMLRHIAEASLEAPDGTVREVIYPVVGGESVLEDLVAEYKTKGTEYERSKRLVFKASYTNHYRRGLIRLLGVLEFRSNNTAHQPVIDALGRIQRHAGSTSHFYPPQEAVALDGVVRPDWEDLVVEVDSRRRKRVVQTVYEACVLLALRDRLRCKEIWVVGAREWRNPDEDLPADFDANRAEHYAALRKPLDAGAFVASVKERLQGELAALNEALPSLDWLEIAERRTGAIRLTKLPAQPEPANLRRLKKAVRARWGTVPLIDILKEAALRTGMLARFTPVGTREAIERDALWKRLLLVAYAYGTNTGVGAVARAGHGHSEADIRYVARRYFTLEGARVAAVELANATFAARQGGVWGESTTTVASDSTHFRSYDQNLFTEWHSRYGGRGVLIYWHVEKRSMVVHSQLLRRFTRNASHTVYQAMLELGRAERTAFVVPLPPRPRPPARDRGGPQRHRVLEPGQLGDLLRQTGEFATNLRDQQELGMIALHLLQASMVYVNTLMVQEVLALPEWEGVLAPEDRRRLTPLFWGHILPYGEVVLDMARRLALSAPEPDPGESTAGDLG